MAISLNPVRPITDEELLQLACRNPGYQFERGAKGELIVTPAGSEGGRRSMELGYQLTAWNRGRSTGVTFDSSTGFRLPDGSVLAPDASWVRLARWETLTPDERRGFAPLCPDAVFEISSESDRLVDLRVKMTAYVKNGAWLAVLIDPNRRTVEIHRPDGTAQLLEDVSAVQFEPELPDFVLDLGPIFS